MLRTTAIGFAVMAMFALTACKKKPAPEGQAAATTATTAAAAPAQPVAPAAHAEAQETNLAGLWAGAFVVNRDKDDTGWHALLNEIPDGVGFQRNGSRQELVIALARAATIDALRFQGLRAGSYAVSNARHARVEASASGAQGPWIVVYDADLPSDAGHDTRASLAQPVKAEALRLTLTGNHWEGNQDDGQIGLRQFMAYGRTQDGTDKPRQVGGVYQFPVEFGANGYVLLHQEGASVEGCYVEGDYAGKQMKIAKVLGTISGGLENGALLAFTRSTGKGPEKGAMSFSPDGKQAYAALVAGNERTFENVREAGGWRLAEQAPPCFPKAEAAPDPIGKAIEASGRAQLYGVNFETDSDVLSSAARPVLDRAAKAVSAHPDWRLRVEGHTDNTGGDGRNQPLSERRAAAVKRYLEGAGVPADRLEAKGYGASQPLMPNDSPFGRAQNRRVELVRQ